MGLIGGCCAGVREGGTARFRLARIVVPIATVVFLALWAAPGEARASFQLGLQDNGFDSPPATAAQSAAYAALQTVDGSTVRITLPWWLIAPQGNTKPAGFDASNPADPHYFFWRNTTDVSVKAAVQHHDRVIVDVMGAPAWAQAPNPPSSVKAGGSWDPNAAELGAFMHAAALRYSGHFPDPADPGKFLPHVSDWEIWNEENLPESLQAPNLVEEYRAMLNASYSGIKSVDPGAVVAIGGLAPVSFIRGLSISPLAFAAQLFCLHRVGTNFLRNRSCPDPAHFDAFAIHPYTLAATPTKHAYHYDDVLVGDMGKVSALIRAVDRLRTAGGAAHHQIWVTEWSWFTNPPNRCVGDKWPTAARYVAWAMYEMWRAGVGVVVWFTVRDLGGTQSCGEPLFTNGGALYASDGSGKPTLRAFTFPFVASVRSGRGFAWGRVPVSGPVRVVVQRRGGRRWIAVGRVRTASDGTFYVRFRAGGNGVFRAVVSHGPVSLSYDSRPIPAKRTHAFFSG